jgi:UDP-sulfoquinovose synthase
MRILVLGADGYLGWPAAMHFSSKGHEVCAVDNYFKRKACLELNCESLVPIVNLDLRAQYWLSVTGRSIQIKIGDITDYSFISEVFKEFRPEVVVHFAEQPSAPYSMMDHGKAFFTLKNNLLGTLNIVYAVKRFYPDCHIVKLGTMGEYGTPDIDIEEGWIEINHKGRKDTFLFPRQASSLYHTAKIQETDLLWFYVRTWGIRVTDLMQGPVYGITTSEIEMDERLATSFHYDELFGTVVNRFVVQAVCGHPLTVYGKGDQIRGYINLIDAIACVYLAAANPIDAGTLRIFNQITETFSVNDLALRVKAVGERLGLPVAIRHIENPRVEKESHYYNPKYTGLLELGLEPHYLTDGVLESMFKTVLNRKDGIIAENIFKGVKWKA